jgi:hypothetical protein
MQRTITTLTIATILFSAVVSLVMGWRLQSGECVTVHLPLNSSIKIGEACGAIDKQSSPNPQTQASPKQSTNAL